MSILPGENSQNTPRKALTIGILLSLVASLFLGLGPSTAKISFDGGADDLTLQGARFGFGMILVWIFIKIRGLSITPIWSIWRRALIMGVASALAAFGYMGSTRYIDVPLASLIFFSYPLTIGVIAWVFRTEAMGIRKSLAVLTGFVGVGMTIGFATTTPSLTGVGLALMAGTLVAIIFVISVPAMKLTSASVVLFSNSVIASGVYALGTLIALAFDYYPTLPYTTIGWVGLGVHVIVMTVGIGLLMAAIHKIGAVRATVVNNLEPLISAIAAAILFSQFLSGYQFLGAGLILGAIIILQTGKPPKKQL